MEKPFKVNIFFDNKGEELEDILSNLLYNLLEERTKVEN